jgi:hypothetical protein
MTPDNKDPRVIRLSQVHPTYRRFEVGLTQLTAAEGSNASRRERLGRTTLRIMGGGFIALTAYIFYESGSTLIGHEIPLRSIPGIIIAVSVMARLWRQTMRQRLKKRRPGGGRGWEGVELKRIPWRTQVGVDAQSPAT